MKLRQILPGDPAMTEILALVHTVFADVPDSPSAALEPDRINRMAGEGAALAVEEDGLPVACLFTRPSRDHPGALYIGTLAVTETRRGRGYARLLIGQAAELARAQGQVSLTLDTGSAATHLHAMFQHLGFRAVSRNKEVVAMLRPL